MKILGKVDKLPDLFLCVFQRREKHLSENPGGFFSIHISLVADLFSVLAREGRDNEVVNFHATGDANHQNLFFICTDHPEVGVRPGYSPYLKSPPSRRFNCQLSEGRKLLF